MENKLEAAGLLAGIVAMNVVTIGVYAFTNDNCIAEMLRDTYTVSGLVLGTGYMVNQLKEK